MTVKEIYDILDGYAPFSLQCDWDNSGIIVEGDSKKEVEKIMVCTDITREIALEAVTVKADLVISHHPVIFKGLKSLNAKSPAVILSNAGIPAICCHTNMDRASGGLNSFLAKLLGFEEVEGAVLDYDQGDSFGVVCKTDKEYTPVEFAHKIKDTLGCDFLRYTPCEKISRVGICTGSGADFIGGAVKNGCDALITGDVKHNFFVEARNMAFGLFDGGHYFTERIFCELMREILHGFSGEIVTPKGEKPPFETI